MRATWTSLGQTLAVSVATILGTGILGLPVVLHQSGIRPFILLFSLNLVAQLGVVIAMAEVMQRAYVSSAMASASESANRSKTYPFDETSDALTSSQSMQDQETPSLHSLAALYIKSPSMRLLFNVLVLAHFVFILCAYTLAASQAYVALFPVLDAFPSYVHSTVFLLVASSLVYACTPGILPPLSVATLTKAVLLTLLIAVTFVRGLSIRRPITADWSLPVLVDPFLMGTIALSGVVNLMPVTFQTCINALPPPHNSSPNAVDRAFITSFRNTTMLAVSLCYFLNIAWTFAVLFVVPQSSSGTASAASSIPDTASLESANALGQISTIPLMEVLKASQDKLNVVIAMLVNSFIAISVTVSFLVMAVGMLHFVKGSISSPSTSEGPPSPIKSLFTRYWLSFAVILSIALCNPAGLLKIMEGATSLALNLEAGVFVVYMFYISRAMHHTCDTGVIPGTLPAWQAGIIISYLIVYYVSAVLVDTFVFIPSVLTGDR